MNLSIVTQIEQTGRNHNLSIVKYHMIKKIHNLWGHSKRLKHIQSLIKTLLFKSNNNSLNQQIIMQDHLIRKSHKVTFQYKMQIKQKISSKINLLKSLPHFSSHKEVLKNLSNSSSLKCNKNVTSITVFKPMRHTIPTRPDTIKTLILTIGFYKKENGKYLESNLFS